MTSVMEAETTENDISAGRRRSNCKMPSEIEEEEAT
jgi:hypothetical protein